MVERTTEPSVRMALFLNHIRNVAPCTALLKLPSESGHGNAYGLCRYWFRVLNAVDSMK
jgi:hypothetical protein